MTPQLPEPGTAEQLRQLARVGFLAVHMGEPAAARAIFSALHVLRPDSPLPHIGLAMAEQAAGRIEEAVRGLREVVHQDLPDAAELHAFLGLMLVQAGLPAQAVPVLRRVAEVCGDDDEPHARMARSLLSQLGEPEPGHPPGPPVFPLH